ncbi:hypothetical protein AJ80_02150 [Polytolypa hystricis UAMH7299]|uniref:Uncharacterized protein n=1 Tax=Polytolypa hystricis (strain UAMH7299) TaxID=1447883 RepID=A0A2B7YS81_POLH7|nr:hypothetical protein AJ80_02150 [Polytolypa hystricis UAMH7299]
MTSPDDAAPVKPPPSFSPGAPLVASKQRYPERLQTSQSLTSPLSESVSSPSPPGQNSSASSDIPSRASSPHNRLSQSTPHLSRSTTLSPLGSQIDTSDDIRSIIIRAFSPVIGVYASPDTDALIRRKGFKDGFRGLIRPFGERIAGKIVIRDSIGSSRSWEDYGVRFVDLGAQNNGSSSAANAGAEPPLPPLIQLEQMLEKHIHSADEPLSSWSRAGEPGSNALPLASPFYKLFLRRLLSSTPSSSHETFAHPVACVIAISSHTPQPLESLRQLYAHTSQGEKRSSPWVHPEYLRYYVLIHDEDRDNIAHSTALFDQMKRHFGLHCHFLRLRSNQCVLTDDDSTPFPQCEWLSASEELASLGEQEALIDVGSDSLYLFESDVTAIKAFVRELVAQSVIPHMENRVALWNDQVASKRRGLSGRFMSMSRRWTGFGSSSRSSGGSGISSGGNYDSVQGFYRHDAIEALLRKLADYAFMLRDWKLASSTYELLRDDYSHDKAWHYHAGAHEMCAVSTLLNPLSSTVKAKLDPLDQLIETACYSYLTRCSDPLNTLRTLALSVELLKTRGGSAAEAAARWAIRMLDMGLLGGIGRILISERVSACYASKTGSGGAKWGARRRKAGMWILLAADSWLKQGKANLASVCLEESDRLYDDVLPEAGGFPLPEMRAFVEDLRRNVKIEYLEARGLNTNSNSNINIATTDEDEELGESVSLLQQASAAAAAEKEATEETSEKLDRRHGHRKSMSILATPLNTMDNVLSSSMNQLRLRAGDEEEKRSDDFE